MTKRTLVLGLVSACVFVFMGCTEAVKTDKGLGKSALLEPQAVLKFSDVPVPAGFKFISEDSYSFESGALRVGVLKYQGKASLEAAAGFYKEQMPMYNWNLLNTVGYGDQLMNFDREGETCTIVLAVKGNTVKITVSVGPKPQSFRSTDKPVK